MPEPGDKETREEFIERCIPTVLEDGTAQTSDQAVAICNSLWKQAKGEKRWAGGPVTSTPFMLGNGDRETFIPAAPSIKAVGDWELEVLGVPFGGPNDKDKHGEYFTSETKFHMDRYPLPALHYYHGHAPDGKPQGAPEEIGKVTAAEKRPDGIWYRVVLDKAKDLAKRVMDAARRGLARASSGTIGHLARVEKTGEITNWPLIELSLFDLDKRTGRVPANRYAVAIPVMKALFERAGIEYPDDLPDGNEPKTEAKGEEQRAEVVQSESQATKASKENKMSEKDEKAPVAEPADIEEQVEASVQRAFKAEREAEAKALEEAKEEKERIDAAVEEALEAQKAEFAKSGRLPWKETHGSPETLKHAALSKYDNLDAADQAVLVGVLNTRHNDVEVRRASDNAVKALAIKLAEDETGVGKVGQRAMKAAGIKSDEVMQHDLSGYGDEWVGVAYSQALWEAIRLGTFVVQNLPSIEVPAGHESIYMPLEGADPTYYVVAETADHDTTSKYPVATVTSSKMATARKQLTLNKMGARVPWSGEMNEDSLIPFVAQLRKQLQEAGSEQLEHAIIDGDTETGGTTNINDIGGTPAATDLFLLFNGFRKSPIITTSANSRSGGTLAVEDYIDTMKLMGTAGINAIDRTKCAFIIDVNTHWKSLTLSEVKTQDSYAAPTLEGGMLRNIWGYPVFVSANMHYKDSDRLADTAGKVDQDTPANNTTGSILAVRWDQWLLGWRRRMTIETTRYPASDSSEIVALMRVGLAQRDTEASAISYNLTIT